VVTINIQDIFTFE